MSAGLLFLIGGLNQDWASRLAGLFAAIVMVGATITVPRLGRWHFAPADGFPMGGMQYQTLLLGVSLWFVFAGNLIGGSKQEKKAA